MLRNKMEHKNNVVVKNSCYLLLGAFIFVAIYGFAPLDITYDGWILNGYIETDITQSYAGWLSYLKSETFFPLTYSALTAYPFGDWASLADSIPIAMFFFKLMSPVLPQTFQFFGVFCCFAMAMQALSASFLLRLFCKNELQVLLGSVLFCVSPVMLERMFRHNALASHWMIVMALYLYFKGETTRKNVAIKLGALSVLTIFVHTYFAPMIIGLFLAFVMDGLWSKRARWHECLVFAISVALCFVSMKLTGLLTLSVSDTSGYGTMGMNLNALFNPVSLDTNWWVPGGGKLHWSAFLPMRALAHNNVESFNYLGLGVILSLVCFCAHMGYLLLRDRKKLFGWIKKLYRNHLFLVLFLACSTVFAISNVVCAFSYQLFAIPLPDAVLKLFNVFRASGRLFWPVNYILLTLSIAHWNSMKRLGNKGPVAVVTVVMIMQLWDLSPVLARKHNDFEVRSEYYNTAGVTEFCNVVADCEVVYFLELRENRALTAILLKNGKANNLWLVRRGEYGVKENTENMQMVTQKLLQGESVYENCCYVTTNAALAEQLSSVEEFIVVQVGEEYIIKPCEK